jgi:hypothetical protein
MKKVILFPLLVLVLFLSACGGADGTPTPTGKTGIKGEVFLAECSGNQVATDCFSQVPYQATLVVYNQKMEEIDRILTDGEGTFEYEIEPGVYYIHPYSLEKYPIATDYQIVVVDGEMTEMTIIYDSGAR